jgi:Integrase core domain
MNISVDTLRDWKIRALIHGDSADLVPPPKAIPRIKAASLQTGPLKSPNRMPSTNSGKPTLPTSAPPKAGSIWQESSTATSRKIIGTATSESLPTTLVTAAWQEALTSRRPPPGLIHHSDRGCQYTSQEFTDLLKSNHVTPGMSRRVNCYDNAHTESFWSTLKTECFGSELPKTRAQAKRMIFDYIYTFYSTTRKHSSLGMLSPNQFEKTFSIKTTTT